MTILMQASPEAWLNAVLDDLDAFLVDHAAAEKKASGMAVSMLSHYPDKPDIVMTMTDLAIEEMAHFREVVKILYARGLRPGNDEKDLYINRLRDLQRKGSELYLLDRLLIASIVEARGCERFGLVADALPEGELKAFYEAITASEARHTDIFSDLARNYFDPDTVQTRMQELLWQEAEIMLQLPIRAALH